MLINWGTDVRPVATTGLEQVMVRCAGNWKTFLRCVSSDKALCISTEVLVGKSARNMLSILQAKCLVHREVSIYICSE